MIKQRKVGQKLKKEFSRYHKGYNGFTIIKKNTKSHEQIHKNFNSPIRKIRKVSSVPKVLQNKGWSYFYKFVKLLSKYYIFWLNVELFEK